MICTPKAYDFWGAYHFAVFFDELFLKSKTRIDVFDTS